MPEMPEVEAVCRKLRTSVAGLIVDGASVWRCGTPAIAELAIGKKLLRVDRKGKHILIRLDGGVTLHTHLRMSGNLRAIPDHRMSPANTRILLRLSNGTGIILEDPRALARMDAIPTSEIDAKLSKLGPEPLSPDFTPDYLITTLRSSRQPIKLFLMDQTRVSGLGNIYVAESLFRAAIDPRKVLRTASVKKIERLHSGIIGVLTNAVQSACNAFSSPGHFEEFEFPCAVYGREAEPCLECGGKIRRIPQGGRSTYFCPGCQK